MEFPNLEQDTIEKGKRKIYEGNWGGFEVRMSGARNQSVLVLEGDTIGRRRTQSALACLPSSNSLDMATSVVGWDSKARYGSFLHPPLHGAHRNALETFFHHQYS